MDAPAHSIRSVARALIVLLAAGCAPQQPATASRAPISGPPATLYVFYYQAQSWSEAPVYDNGEEVALVRGEKYVRLSLPPGPHHISSYPPSLEWGFDPIDIDVQAGAKYYASMTGHTFLNEIGDMFLGTHSSRRPMKALSAEEGQALMRRTTLQEQPFPQTGTR